jgi:aspartyl/asparaginyl beta-hydroxylase (cupin superfamily)
MAVTSGPRWSAATAAVVAAVAVGGWVWAVKVFAPQFDPYDLLQLSNLYIHRTNPPFPDKDYYFPDAHVLEANWTVMADEWRAVVAKYGVEGLPEYKNIDPLQGTITRNNAWRMVMMVVLWGETKNAAEFPRTMELLRQCRGIRNAFFSVLEPGTALTPHWGPQSAQMRYHLGIDVREPERCTLNVEGVERHWYNGDGFVWDDRYLHSARNEGTTPRVILFLDVDRRDLTVAGHVIDRVLVWLFRAQPYFGVGLRNAELARPP